MTDGTMANSIYLVLMLMLVASAFAARRVPLGRTLKMAAAWVLIFALGLLLYGLFDRSSRAENIPAPAPPAKTPTLSFT